MPVKDEGGGSVDEKSYDYSQSRMMRHYEATIIVGIDNKSKLNILKNRYGAHKNDITLLHAVEVFSDILSQAAFDGRMDMFQEGMKIQLIDTITKTLKGGVKQ